MQFLSYLWAIFSDARSVRQSLIKTPSLIPSYKDAPSGTSGCHPGRVYCAFRNASFKYRFTDAEQKRVRDAVNRGKSDLRDVLNSTFKPVGRASEGRWL